MKKSSSFPMMEMRTLMVLVGLAVGFGIVVHELFFLAAAVLLVGVSLEWVAQKVQHGFEQSRWTHRHP